MEGSSDSLLSSFIADDCFNMDQAMMMDSSLLLQDLQEENFDKLFENIQLDDSSIADADLSAILADLTDPMIDQQQQSQSQQQQQSSSFTFDQQSMMFDSSQLNFNFINNNNSNNTNNNNNSNHDTSIKGFTFTSGQPQPLTTSTLSSSAISSSSFIGSNNSSNSNQQFGSMDQPMESLVQQTPNMFIKQEPGTKVQVVKPQIQLQTQQQQQQPQLQQIPTQQHQFNIG